MNTISKLRTNEQDHSKLKSSGHVLHAAVTHLVVAQEELVWLQPNLQQFEGAVGHADQQDCWHEQYDNL
eukprot:2597881-Amphidinium_carterae.3